MKKVLQGNPLYSIFTGTCPVCQQAGMYKNPNPYKLTETLKMHEHCLHCHTKFKIEPSFFYGAMYVSYGVGVAFAVAAFVIAKLFIGADLIQTFIAIVGTMVVFMPIIMRWSRNIWINIFVKYDPTAKTKTPTKN